MMMTIVSDNAEGPMLALTRTSSTLILELVDELGKRRSMNLAKLAWLSVGSQESYLLPAIDFFNGRSRGTQQSSLDKLIYLGGLMGRLEWTDFPEDSRGWQEGLLRLYAMWLSGPEGGQLQTRITTWNGIYTQHLRMLRDVVGLIPYSVVIPRAARSVSSEDLRDHHSDLLGQVRDDGQPQGNKDKLLVPINIDRTDAEYLDLIRDTLAHRRAILNNCANEWIKQISDHFRFGEKLIAANSWEKVSSIIDDRRWRNFEDDGIRAKGLYHFANGRTEESLGSLLSILVNRYDSLVSKDLLAMQPELPHLCTIDMSCAPTVVSDRVKTLTRLNWMLGNLSPYDMGFILLFIVLRHPRFTPQSILSALILDKNGHPYFELTDVGLKWRLEKRRAHKMKTEILDEDTAELLLLITDMTSRHRRRLKECGDPIARSFFIIADRGECRVPSYHGSIRCLAGRGDVRAQTSDAETWIGNLFPIVQQSGMEKGSLNLRKVRATEGVLEWFKSGSVGSMADKLGNSTRVALEHYLPKPLVRAWHVRQLRTFQNLWLAVASEGTQLQLAATDFTELTQLHEFLKRMLKLYPDGSSPLASELHLRCAKSSRNAVDNKNSRLAVSISAKNLAYLYLYQQCILEAGIEHKKLGEADSVAELSPLSLVALAELLRFRIPEDKNPKIRLAHEEALALLPELKRTINWTHIVVAWGVQS